MMRYKDYVWPSGPETVQVSCAQRLAELNRPNAGTVVQSMGAKTRAVTGTGTFVGEGCAAEFEKLSALLAQGNSGMLKLTGMEPFPAFFSSLKMAGEAGPDCIRYSFAFVEAGQEESQQKSGSMLCKGGESLWKIAAEYGVTVDALRALNPMIQRPGDLPANTRVVLP